MKRSINGQVWQGDKAALDEMERGLAEIQRRKEAVAPEELQSALDTITDYLATGWSTGGGRRLRQFIWSLWNGSHLINLYDLSSGLDGRLSDAMTVTFRGAMAGVLTEDQKRYVLKHSGEFARWEQASVATPEDEDVIYPPLAIGTDSLRRLARSAENSDRRLEEERRAEAARIDEPSRPCRV